MVDTAERFMALRRGTVSRRLTTVKALRHLMSYLSQSGVCRAGPVPKAVSPVEALLECHHGFLSGERTWPSIRTKVSAKLRVYLDRSGCHRRAPVPFHPWQPQAGLP